MVKMLGYNVRGRIVQVPTARAQTADALRIPIAPGLSTSAMKSYQVVTYRQLRKLTV
jgi:hypothetical protein